MAQSEASAADYRFVAQFPQTGDFWSLLGPRGVAADAFGNVYVADTGNNRIQKFDSSGTYLTPWGSLGTGEGQLNSPQGLAVDSSGYVYIADTNNNRIQKFDSSGTYLTPWGSLGTGEGQFNSPQGLAVDSSGNIYVADTGNGRIQKFDSSGTFSAQWGSQGSGEGQFDAPRGIAVDSSGYVYIADTNNNRIQKFDSSGTYLARWGSPGSGEGQFDSPQGLAVDASGNVYAADTNNNRIQKFDSAGNYLTRWGSQGSGEGQFDAPQGIAVDSSGNVYIADTNNNRIQKFSLICTIAISANNGGELLCHSTDNPTDDSTDGSIEVPAGKTLTCTVTPREDEGYRAGSVGGCGDPWDNSTKTTGPITFTTGPITDDCTMIAKFVKTFTVTPLAGPNGSITPAVPLSADYNDIVSFTIEPATGYHVASVNGCGGTLTEGTYTTGRITGDCTVSAEFAINTYTLTASAGADGIVMPDGVSVVNYGSSPTYAITPFMNYHVTDVLVDGTSVGAIHSYTFTNVVADHSISATFAMNVHTLAVLKSGSGTGKVTGSRRIECGSVCSAAYDQGASVTLTALPDEGSVFTGWSGGGCAGTGTCTATMYADKSVVATFAAVQAGMPKLSVKPQAVNFGSLQAGHTSAAKEITVSNRGKGSLVIDSITLAGKHVDSFEQTNSCAVIDPGGSCLIRVSFVSAEPFGGKSAVLTISSTHPKRSTVKVKLAGKTDPPKISVSPKSINFNSVQSGAASPSKTITIRNVGVSDLIVDDVTIDGANAGEFSRINACGTVRKGDSCTVYVTFSPVLPASQKVATLKISSNNPKHANISVKLTGVAKNDP